MDWPQAPTVFVVFAFILAGAFELRQPLSVQTLPFLRRWSLHFSHWISLAFHKFRFHPLEVIADRGVILAPIYLVQPTLSYFIAILGKAFMSPGLHRTHHATEIDLQNANFGIIFSFWDRLFALRRTGPIAPPVGLAASSTFSPLFLLVTLPWREWKSSVPAMPHSKSKAAPLMAIHT